MKDKRVKKILLILIIITSIISLIILGLLRNILNNKENDNKNSEIVDNEDRLLLENKELKNNAEYYKIIEIVSQYIQCFYYEDSLSRAKDLLDDVYIDSKKISNISQLNKNYFDGYITYNPEEIKYATKKNVSVFFVKGKFEISEQKKDDKEFNFVVKIDYKNYSFSIIPELCKNSDELYNEIIRNKNNELKINAQTNIRIASRHFSNYIQKTNLDLEDSFYLLNSDYRKNKFNNSLELYKKYIDNKYVNKEYYLVEECFVYMNDEYNIYICKDSEGNNFIIKENNVNSFEIFLDSYTVVTADIKNYYNNLSEEEKVIYNCENIIESIKTGNHEYSYNYIRQEEKDNKYNTIDKYTEYLNKNYLHNFEITEDAMLDVLDTGYIYVLNMQNDKEKKQVIIEINLKQDIDFEISINIV